MPKQDRLLATAVLGQFAQVIERHGVGEENLGSKIATIDGGGEVGHALCDLALAAADEPREKS